MKEKFNISLLIVFITLFTFSACKKKDTYDYNAILPANISITGAETVYTDGTIPAVYKLDGLRGGSEYNWTVEGASATITGNGSYKVSILFDKPSGDISDVKIICQETTIGGLTGEYDTLTITVKLFYPLANGLDDLTGTVTGVDDDDAAWYGSVSQDYVLTKNNGKLNIKGLFYTKLTAWGTFTEGGSCDMTVNLDNPYVSIPNQKYASNDEGDPDGDWVYYIEGSGVYDNSGAAPVLDFFYDILYIDPSKPDEGPLSMWDGKTGAKPFLHAIIDFNTKKIISIGIAEKFKNSGKVPYGFTLKN